MEAILDTNFIISCIRKRINFIEQLSEQGFTIKVPFGVIKELKELKKRPKLKNLDKESIDVAFGLFEQNKIRNIKLTGNSVDLGLIKMGKKGKYIATLDKDIQKKVPKKIRIISSKRKVEIF